MDERPVTRYATAPDGVSIAFQVFGEGPVDVVFASTLVPIDLLWDEPGFVGFARRLGAFSRTVWCDARGQGASTGSFLDCYVEEIADTDLTAVLHTAGCEQVVLVGFSNAGATAIRYAVSHQERIRALILIDTFAHYVQEDDYPLGIPSEDLKRLTTSRDGNELWGTGWSVEIMAPSKMRDEGFRAWRARSERLGVGPGQIAKVWVCGAMQDVRALLPTVAVPTLVLHREGDRFLRVGAGRYLAEHIPGTKYVELRGEDHLFFVGDTDALLDEIEEFVTGGRQAPEGDVLTATILFTDIVASTEQSARLGHRKWTALSDAHDTMVRAVLARYRGREIKTTGDGFLATFDATTRAVRAATEIVTAAKGIGLDVRAGVHTGEVEVRPDDVVGLTVSIAKRICDLAGAGEVFVSEAVKALLLGSGIATSEQGTHVLKGVPEEWRLFAVATMGT
ncbi:MAG: alpha/beta fold hydrolase [Acidimicrobiia bacterium]